MKKSIIFLMLSAFLIASCSRIKTENFDTNDLVGIWVQDAVIPDAIMINANGTGRSSSFLSGRMRWTLEDDILTLREDGDDRYTTYLIDSIVVDTYDGYNLKGKRKMMYVRQEFLKHEGRAYDYRGWLETNHDLSEEQLDWLRSEEGIDWLNSYNNSDSKKNKKSSDWLASKTGKRWLKSTDGQAWQKTPAGKTYVEEKDYYHWKYVQLSEEEFKEFMQ